jgi:small subunit ribosomal protein S8
MLTDPIADMLTRIRNANVAMHDQVKMPSSKQKLALAKILQQEGYISGFSTSPSPTGPGEVLTVEMKYSPDRDRTISGLRRVSKPGLRVYSRRHGRAPRPRGPRCGRPVHQPGADDRPRGAQAQRRRRESSASSGDAGEAESPDMSRIGKAPPSLSRAASTYRSSDRTVTVKGPKGTLSAARCPELITVRQDADHLGGRAS